MISNRNLNGILAAIRLAKKSQSEMTNHHAAILFHGWRPISYGFNLKKTHSKSNSKFRFIHAETHAVLGVPDFKLKNSEMYLARVGYWNKKWIMLSKPCEYCQEIIKLAKISRVYYTVDGKTIGIWNVRKNLFNEIKTDKLVI